MNQQGKSATALVTFAIYDEAPIACQGNDDQRKIRVLSKRIEDGSDVQARALACAIAMMRASGAYVQVWQVASEARCPDNLWIVQRRP